MKVRHVKTMPGHTKMAILHIMTVKTYQDAHRTYKDGHSA